VRFYGRFDFSFVLPSRLSKLEFGASATERRLQKMPKLDGRAIFGGTALQQLHARCESDGGEQERIAKLARDEVCVPDSAGWHV
jgi:hypothetical protein